jgi:hypothetical protein
MHTAAPQCLQPRRPKKPRENADLQEEPTADPQHAPPPPWGPVMPPRGGLASSCRHPVTRRHQSSRRSGRSNKPTCHRPMGRPSRLQDPMTSQGVDPPATGGRGHRLRPISGPLAGNGGGRGMGKMSSWPPRDDRQHRSSRHEPPLRTPCLDGSSPQPGGPPREEWTRATPPPSLLALQVVPAVGSSGGMARKRKRVAAALGMESPPGRPRSDVGKRVHLSHLV